MGTTPTIITVRWTPAVLRAWRPPSDDGDDGLVHVPLCGRRLRVGRWVDVVLRHDPLYCELSGSTTIEFDGRAPTPTS